MDPILFTPKVKLTLVTKAGRGSQEFEWMHEMRSDPQTTFYSIAGQSKTFEDTERYLKDSLPLPESSETAPENKTFRVFYAVHELLESTTNPDESTPSRFVGHINIRSVTSDSLYLPPSFFPAELSPTANKSPSVHVVEVGYSFLPSSWSRGIATESVKCALNACRANKAAWKPYEKVYVRAVVNIENPASQRVMEKSGLERLGVYVWEGQRLWFMGKWNVRNELVVCGKWLIE